MAGLFVLDVAIDVLLFHLPALVCTIHHARDRKSKAYMIRLQCRQICICVQTSGVLFPSQTASCAELQMFCNMTQAMLHQSLHEYCAFAVYVVGPAYNTRPLHSTGMYCIYAGTTLTLSCQLSCLLCFSLQGGLHRAVHMQRLQGPCGVPHPVAAACAGALQALQAHVDLPDSTQLLVGGTARAWVAVAACI
jgi:hypothetical protein